MAVGARVLPVDEVGRGAHVARDAAAGREVPGRHVADRGLLTGTERPVKLLFRLVVQTVDVLDLTGGRGAHGRATGEPRGEVPVVAVERKLVRVVGAVDSQLRVAEPREHAQRQDDEALIGRQSRAVDQVGRRVVAVAVRGEQRNVVVQVADSETRGSNERIPDVVLQAPLFMRALQVSLQIGLSHRPLSEERSPGTRASGYRWNSPK